MRSSNTSAPRSGGRPPLALVVGAVARPILRLFSWFAAVARHSGLPGILIVVGLTIWPVAIVIALLGDGRTRTMAWSVAVVAGAVFLAAGFWRKSALLSAQRRRRSIANAEALAELQQLDDTEWVDAIARRRQAVHVGAISIANPSFMARRRRRRERRKNERRVSGRRSADRRRGDRRQSETTTDADPPDSR